MKHTQYILAYLILWVFMNNVSAQQPAQYSLYMFNKYQSNIAYAGLDNSLSITGTVRRQWNGISGSPLVQNINAHMPVYYLRGAFGVGIEQDIIGAHRNINIKTSYAFQWQTGKTGTMSLGISGGIIQQVLNGNVLRTPDGNYNGNTINHQDDLLAISTITNTIPDFELGAYYQSEKMEFGLSVNHLLEPKINNTLKNFAEIVLLRNYLFIFATEFKTGSFIKIKPAILFKSDLKESQGEISIITTYKDNIFIGTAFRGYNTNTRDALVMMAGLKINSNWTLVYGYDWTLSPLRNTSSGTHELVLNYNINKPFGKGKMPPIIYNPRFY